MLLQHNFPNRELSLLRRHSRNGADADAPCMLGVGNLLGFLLYCPVHVSVAQQHSTVNRSSCCCCNDGRPGPVSFQFLRVV